jgi:WD40 repeat protein
MNMLKRMRSLREVACPTKVVSRSLFCLGVSLAILGGVSSLPSQAEISKSNVKQIITKSNSKRQAAINFVQTRTLNMDESTSMFMSSDGKTLVTASPNGKVKLFSLPSGKLIHTLSAPSGIDSIILSPDKQTLIISGGDSENKVVSIINANTGKSILTISNYKNISSITITPDGKTIVGNHDKGIYLWDLKTGRQVSKLPNSGSLNTIQISPNGQYLVAAGTDRSTSENIRLLRIWNLKTGKILHNIGSRGLFTNSIAISADSKTFAISKGGSDTVTEIQVWNLSTGKLIKDFKSFTGDPFPEASSIELSPDGQFFMTGYSSMEDNAMTNIEIWNSRTGKKMGSISSHKDYSRILKLSLDGRTMVSSGGDKKIIIWRQK